MKVRLSPVGIDSQLVPGQAGSSKTAATAGAGNVEGSLEGSSAGIDRISVQSIKSTPPTTPQWSENQPWAETLETINTDCLTSLNTAFEACQDDLEADDWEHVPLDIWEQRLDATFEVLRTRANTIIDESKAKAKSCIAEIPPHVRGEAVGWFAKGVASVVRFFGFIGEGFRKAVKMMRNSVRDAWRGILRALRMGVARRALVAAEGVRRLNSSRELEAGERRNGVQLRVLQV